MTPAVLHHVLRVFRRQLMLVRCLRYLLALGLVAALGGSMLSPDWQWRQMIVLAGTGIVLTWLVLLMKATRQAREVQTGSALLATGQLDEAEVWLMKVMGRFSLSLQAKLLACAELASLLFRQNRYQDVADTCRELLRQPLNRMQNVMVAARLLLADSLLLLDRIQEAYEAMRPIYDYPLSLTEQMKLLPVQLRYELAANHAASAVKALPEKVKIAELLDAPQAALVHALLAEACLRQAMNRQGQFLLERARLYHDLEPLAQRYAVLAPIAAPPGGGLRRDLVSGE